jgi:hypothetical protein
LHEGRLLTGLFLDRLLGRHGDRPDLAPVQSQSVLEEVADLAEAPADTGVLLDDGPRLLGRARRVLLEVLFQGGFLIDQGAAGLMARAASQAR